MDVHFVIVVMPTLQTHYQRDSFPFQEFRLHFGLSVVDCDHNVKKKKKERESAVIILSV